MTKKNTLDSRLADSDLLVKRLARSDAFPHPVEQIEVLETHISWVILTGSYAYKIKKPVNLGFLDFSTLELRKHFCDEELRLNRRFAPQLYIDVVAIGGEIQHPRIGDEPVLEWAVLMHEFPADARLDRLTAAGRVGMADMRELGASIARSHSRAPAADANGDLGTARAISRPAIDNFATLTESCAKSEFQHQLGELEQWTTMQLDQHAETFDTRLLNACVRECHGDLHLANLVRIDDQIVPFDCLEFNPELRWIDVMSEVSFLVMDAIAHERTEFAYSFLNRYLEVSGDYAGVELLPFYLVYRCVVRAKVAALRHRQSNAPADLESVRNYLNLAAELARPRQAPILIITHGFSGSGKTWLTTRLTPRIPAIRLRSDLERKRLHGLSALESSDSAIDDGIYGPTSSASTYARLESLARQGLSAGFSMLIDAAFLQPEQRARFRQLAADSNLPFVILDCRAQPETLRQRVRHRLKAGSDASEADLTVLDHQLASASAFADDEIADIIDVDTEVDIDLDELCNQISARQSRNPAAN